MDEVLENILLASRDAAILAIIVGLLTFLAGKWIPAAWRHVLWLIVAVRLMMPVLPTSSTSWQQFVQPEMLEVVSIEEVEPTGELTPLENRESRVPEQLDALPIQRNIEEVRVETETPVLSSKVLESTVEAMPTKVSERVVDEPFDWKTVLLSVWGLGVLFFITLSSWLSFRFARQVKRLTVEDGEQEVLEEVLSSLGEQLGLKKLPSIRITDAVATPALFGVFRPQILVPSSITKNLSEYELKLVLMHELGHWQRRDLWISVLLSFLQMVHWFNPMVWWAFHRTRVECERATDAWVLRRAGADKAQSYGKMLVQLLDKKIKPQASLSSDSI